MDSLLICSHCGISFPKGRKIAKFCSQRCRIYAKRKAEITTEEICPHCNTRKGAIFTSQEFREELDKILKMQQEIKNIPKPTVDDLGDVTLVADSQEYKR